MAKTADVVIGAGYGDEGKGLMTDYFAAGELALVVRFNGGAQAGHTVTTPSGQRHVFHHFGSGVFAGAVTYLSRHFAVNPPLFLKERAALQPLVGVIPDVFVDNRAPVTTFYDMLVNQIVEDFRANGRHGSCGMGFGETIGRNAWPEFRLTVADLRKPALLRERLLAIRDQYLPARLAALGIPAEFVEEDEQRRVLATTDVLIESFIAQAALFLESAVPVRNARHIMQAAHSIVMEGAQGLMLDMDRGAFPYVTRSNTGLTNALEVAREAHMEALNVTYVTRAYLTRHGAGPMAHELATQPYARIEDLTNQPNPYQGSLRFAYLDHDVLETAIRQDFGPQAQAARSGLEVRAQLAVTCLDQLDDQVRYWRNGALCEGSVDTQLADLERILPVGFLSYGPTRNTVRPVVLGKAVA